MGKIPHLLEIEERQQMTMLGLVRLCQLSGWKRFLYTAGCFKNKNVLKLEAGMLEKIRTF